ncbi:hypothetical protein FVE85_7407 [Porphyridium purpureum]|uniref:Uncharacterized protein n=1 Tax=Porphyridium purpureum TaxID=35688 RepID=A0A5J4Z9X6_PORPP|nr:hypothetical protein FVE85_7407 [Porphyridium purpureum]|eukprot:POR0808..scf295_1
MEEPLVKDEKIVPAVYKAGPISSPAAVVRSLGPPLGQVGPAKLASADRRAASHDVVPSSHQKENAVAAPATASGAAAPSAAPVDAPASGAAASRKRDAKLRTPSPGSSVSSSIGAPTSAVTGRDVAKTKNAAGARSGSATADSKPSSNRPVRTSAQQVVPQSHNQMEPNRKRSLAERSMQVCLNGKRRTSTPKRTHMRLPLVPEDVDDLSSDEELEFQDFVTKIFEPKYVREEQYPSWPADGRHGGGTAIIHSQVESSEIPFWNLQHRKLIGVQLEEHSRTSDLKAICGKTGSSDACASQDTGAQYSQWNESYPFRLFYNGSELPLELINHSISLAVASSGTEKGFHDGSMHRAARLRARTATGRKKPEAWGNEPRDNISKRFQTHPCRKGWLKCVQCEHDVWPPNRSKHICASS